VACRKRDHRAPGAESGAFAVGDPGYAPGGFLHRQRSRLELGRRGIGAVVAGDVGAGVPHQQLLGREAGIFILRRLARHRSGALDQGDHRFVGEVGRGDAGRSPADEEAKADLLALRPLDILERPEPDLDPGRSLADIENVGGVRARSGGALDQCGGTLLRGFDVKHGGHLGRRRRKSKARALRHVPARLPHDHSVTSARHRSS
jgi:hypothetical protein